MRKEIYHFNDHLHSHSYGLYFHKIAIETVKSEMTRLNKNRTQNAICTQALGQKVHNFWLGSYQMFDKLKVKLYILVKF